MYVDDLQIIRPRDSPHIEHLKLGLRKRFDMTDLGEAKNYLGIQISWVSHKLSTSTKKS